MASDKIKYDDLVSGDVNKKLKELEDGLKGVLKVQQDIIKEGQKGGKNAENIERTNKAIKDSASARKGLTDVQKTQLKLNELETKEGKELLALKTKLTKKRRETKQAIEGETSAYKKLTNSTNKAQASLKNLAAQYGVNSKQAKKAQKDFDKLEKELRQVNEAAKDGRRDVGRYGQALNGFKSLLGAAGIVGGVQLLTRGIRDSFNTVKEFGQSIANLSAITGATGKDLDFYKEKAIELGSKTTLSAKQVAEGFKLIGSAKPELLQDAEALAAVTEQAITLAEAAGIDLPEAAGALTNTLNQFGASAEEAGSFVDILAAGSKAGAGDINFLNAAFDKSGTVAKGAGLTFKESAAALEVLAKSGADASTSGTNFRNILINLQKEGIGFVDGQFDLKAALEQVNGQLDSIEDPAKRAAASVDLFGKQNLAAGTFLRGNIDLFDEYNVALGETGVAAEQQAINNNTLQGAIKSLESAWEGIVLSFENGTGVFDGLKDVIFFLAKNLKSIIKVIATGTAAFLAYKTTVLATSAATKAYAIGQKIAAIAGKLFNGTIKLSNISFKALNATMKANPIGLIIAGITTLITAMGLFGDSVDDAADAQDRLNDAQAAGLENGKKIATQLNANTDSVISKLEQEAKIRIANGEDASKVEKEKTAAILEEYNKQLNGLRTRISVEKKETKSNSEETQKELEKELKNQTSAFNFYQKRLIELQKDPENNRAAIESVKEIIKAQTSNRLKFLTESIAKEGALSDGRIEGLTQAEKDLADKIAAIQNDLLVKETEISSKRNKARQKALESLAKQLRDSQTRLISDELLRTTTQIESRYDDLIQVIIEKIKKGSVLAAQGNALIVSLEKERLNEIIRLNIDTNKRLRDEAQKRFDDEANDLKEANDKRKAQNEKELDSLTALQEFRFIKKADDLERELQAELDNSETLTELMKSDLLNRLDVETRFRIDALRVRKERELENEKLTADERTLIVEQYQEDVNGILRDQLETEEEINAKSLAATKKTNEEKLQSYIDLTQKIISLTSQELDKKFALRNEENAKEITETEENIDRQQELASQGKDNQLAFEEKKLAEAHLKEKEELEKQAKIKEGIALAEMYLSAYAARLSDDPDTAGTKALQDVLLASGISKLLAAGLGYEEGGYTGDNFGTSEVAGVVHGQEFVIDAATTKQMGLRGEDMSGFKNRMFSGQMFNHDFMTTDMSSKQAQMYDNSNVVNEIKQLREDFKSRPIQQVDVDKLGNLIETIHKNGVKTVIKYKGSNRI